MVLLSRIPNFQIAIVILGRNFSIYTFGKPASIADFKNIAHLHRIVIDNSMVAKSDSNAKFF